MKPWGLVVAMTFLAGAAGAKNAPIGTWNDPNLDGWEPGRTKPPRMIQRVKKEGTDGKGCLMVLTVTGWSQAAATDKGKVLLAKGDTITLDVFARKEDFPHGMLKIGIGIQSDKLNFDELPLQDVKFDEWQTLTFPYDRERHKQPQWTLINIITMTDDAGTVLIDNVRIE